MEAANHESGLGNIEEHVWWYVTTERKSEIAHLYLCGTVGCIIHSSVSSLASLSTKLHWNPTSWFPDAFMRRDKTNRTESTTLFADELKESDNLWPQSQYLQTSVFNCGTSLSLRTKLQGWRVKRDESHTNSDQMATLGGSEAMMTRLVRNVHGNSWETSKRNSALNAATKCVWWGDEAPFDNTPSLSLFSYSPPVIYRYNKDK